MCLIYIKCIRYIYNIETMNDKFIHIDFNLLCIQFLNIVCESCQIMQAFSQNPSLCWKGMDNPVTEVDYLIQSYIVQKIHLKFGQHHLSVVGEEDLTYKSCPQFKQKIEKYLKNTTCKPRINKLPCQMKFAEDILPTDLTIWIDPIDCTQGFINNRKYETTILIGVAHKGKPVCGIIGQPYKQNASTQASPSYYEPTIYFGSILSHKKCAYEYNIGLEGWKILQKKANADQALTRGKVAIGYRKINKKQAKIMSQLNLESVMAGGAGFKCLKVIKNENQVESVLFVDAKTSKWDSCAGEAIIKAMGGYCIKPCLTDIDYNTDSSYDNKEGFLFTLNEQTFKKFIDISSKE